MSWPRQPCAAPPSAPGWRCPGPSRRTRRRPWSGRAGVEDRGADALGLESPITHSIGALTSSSATDPIEGLIPVGEMLGEGDRGVSDHASAWPINSPGTTGLPSRPRCHAAILGGTISGTSTSSTALVGARSRATIFWANTSMMNAGLTPSGPRGDPAARLAQDPADRLDRVAIGPQLVAERDDQRLRGRAPPRRRSRPCAQGRIVRLEPADLGLEVLDLGQLLAGRALVMTPAHGWADTPVPGSGDRNFRCDCLAASGLCSREDRTSPPQAVAPCTTAGPVLESACEVDEHLDRGSCPAHARKVRPFTVHVRRLGAWGLRGLRRAPISPATICQCLAPSAHRAARSTRSCHQGAGTCDSPGWVRHVRPARAALGNLRGSGRGAPEGSPGLAPSSVPTRTSHPCRSRALTSLARSGDGSTATTRCALRRGSAPSRRSLATAGACPSMR